MAVELSTLLPFRPKRERTRIRLVCLPFAGGAASAYRGWEAHLPDDVDLCAVELPARGTRFGERPVDQPDRLLEELSLLEKLPPLPTVYFGHSLGGRIAFALIQRGLRADALIVSASRPAHVKQPTIRSSLPKDALVRELKRLGGTPRAVLDDPDMVDLMLPIVRADFSILEGLTATAEQRVSCPVTVLGATDDAEVPLAEVAKWEALAAGAYRFVTLQGGHFFLSTHTEKVVAEVRRVLDETLKG